MKQDLCLTQDTLDYRADEVADGEIKRSPGKEISSIDVSPLHSRLKSVDLLIHISRQSRRYISPVIISDTIYTETTLAKKRQKDARAIVENGPCARSVRRELRETTSTSSSWRNGTSCCGYGGRRTRQVCSIEINTSDDAPAASAAITGALADPSTR